MIMRELDKKFIDELKALCKKYNKEITSVVDEETGLPTAVAYDDNENCISIDYEADLDLGSDVKY